MARKKATDTIVYGGYARVGADWTVGFPADHAPEEGSLVSVRKVDGEVQQVRVKRAVAVTIPVKDNAVPTVFFTYARLAK
jgi:hypothetical protein